jgi:hypothetical protein
LAAARSRSRRGRESPSTWARTHRQSAIDASRGERVLTATRHSSPSLPSCDPTAQEAMTSRGDQGKHPIRKRPAAGRRKSPSRIGAAAAEPVHHPLRDLERRAAACKIPSVTSCGGKRVRVIPPVEIRMRGARSHRAPLDAGPDESWTETKVPGASSVPPARADVPTHRRPPRGLAFLVCRHPGGPVTSPMYATN